MIGCAVGLRLLESAVQWLLVGLLNRGSGQSTWSRFGVWDAQLYAQVAEHGYPERVVPLADGSGLADGGNLAFSPLYPLLERVLSVLTGLSALDAGILLSWLAGCLLSVCVCLLAMDAGHGRRAGLLASALVGALPMAVVLQAGYAEALFAALCAAALLAARRDRWWLAGCLALAAGLTRPVGYVTLAGLLVLGWPRLRDRWPRGGPVVAAVLLGAAGTLGFWSWVAVRTGRWDGWFHVQQVGWHTRFDAGADTRRWLWSTLTRPDGVGLAGLGAVACVLGFALLVLTVCWRRDQLPYVAVAALAWLSMAASTNYWHSRPRLLLAGAVLVVPLGHALSRAQLRYVLPWLGVAVLASGWFGAYMLTVWHYAI